MLVPVLAALLMVIVGAILMLKDERELDVRPAFLDWSALIAGIVIVLYGFMADTLAALPADMQTLSQLRPSEFNWAVYLVGFTMLVLFVWRMGKPSEAKVTHGTG